VATWEIVCEVIASLPGTELETDRQGRPTWRVDGRPLLRRYPQLRVPNEETLLRSRGEVVAFACGQGLREALLQQDPETFFVTPLWSNRRAVLVWLDRLSLDDLRELIEEAWHARASRSRVGALERE
jgi:hypothetical protein